MAEGGGRRRNPLLSQFYFEQSQQQQHQQPAEPPKPAPTDINGDTFEASLYFSTLLKERSLAELVRIDNELKGAVRSLDNGMKTLVYENYNKFISATETIRSMKQNVNKMESDMRVLSDNMRNIDSLCTNINETMAVRRDKIDELSGVFRLLKGRQFLFDLPTRLRHDLDHGQYADAVKYFLLTSDALTSYEHLPSFGAINQECRTIMATLKSRLWERVREPSTEPAPMAEAVGLLVDMHEDYATLLRLFVAYCQARFRASLVQPAPSPAVGVSGADIKAGDDLNTLSQRVLPPLVTMGSAFVSALVDRPVLTSTESGAGRDALLLLLNDSIDAYYALAQVVLASESNNVSDVIASITVLSTALGDAVTKLPLRLEKKVADMVLGAIRGYVERDLASVQVETMAALDAVMVATAPRDACNAAVDTICRAIASFLENLQPLLDPKWEVERDVLSLVRQIATKLAGLFVGIANRALEFVGRDTALVLAGLLVMLEKRGVPMAKEGVAALAVLARAHPTAIDPQYRANELVGVLHSAADTLLQSYARARCSHVARIVTRSIEAGNWLSPELTSVRKPRMVVSVLVDELKAAERAVSALFGADPEVGLALAAAARKPSHFRAPNDDMARMFNERLRVYDRVDFSGASMAALLARCAIKAWCESLRTRVLNKHALHQMQVDAHALRAALLPMLSADALRVTDALLAQVEGSAEDRCVEPQPLNVTVISQILSAAAAATTEAPHDK